MNLKEKLNQAMLNVVNEQAKLKEELEKLEEDFSNVKLNPYGITSIDFTKRQETAVDLIKLEGVEMGLKLALETCEEVNESSEA
jgi:hypothetical protein